MSHIDRDQPSDPPEHADPGQDAAVLRRRQLLRHSALLVGVAGVGTAIAAAPKQAAAADGDNLLLGENNAATSTTNVSINQPVGSNNPTLALRNGSGPSLSLQPLAADFPGAMELGEIANTELGPIIGVDSELGLATTYLATGIDLADLPTPYPLPVPVRLLDTRTAGGRARVLRTSSGAWDSTFRLKSGAWIDVEAVVVTGEYETPGAWVNIVSVSSQANGNLAVYPPGAYPGTSTLNFTKGVTLANGAFVGTGIVAGRYAIRIRASKPTHVVLDLTGLVIKGTAPTPTAGKASGQAKKRSSNAKLKRRLRSSLAERLRSNLER
ncbi:hypothetical protein MLP_25420 [Microlunatus phosphovorus NM-1]|uniref:Uncharacterized protein n=1 Tax=Microlunatus phosphovorus (strain ATCC 700054 / DSM 10555 / JCM 9379 / NBRC 101784 / NCIMB 13414 / VKM Ac-1990 / NM-1) TaxID=1032480 RepID=F5XGS4_MICPN|nr:hypothetical protein [Microlunatus phosphovorus]BAK35556.1 hypothetical protein MLP_25420 [Microlunatus phosphovorus NM-1]